jgi:endonuclease G
MQGPYDDRSGIAHPFSPERRPIMALPAQSRTLVVPVALLVLVGLLIAFVVLLNLPTPPSTTEISPPAPAPAEESNIHLTMGNPSGATPDPDKPDNYLMDRPFFALSYNNKNVTPNWVSWCLQKSDFGNAPREQFRFDRNLPDGFKKVTPDDYTGSGFDRGHMCPAADRTSTEEASKATFVMTNIIPQSPHCNQKAWADLEDYCRELVRKKHQTLYIVAGPEGQGGVGSEGLKEFIGPEDKVTVPAKCWKVILALEDGTGEASDVNRVNSDSRLIAVVMPNDQSVEHGWAKYRKSAKEVEKSTGYHFFDRVPAAIIEPLKERVDKEHIPAGHHKKPED